MNVHARTGEQSVAASKGGVKGAFAANTMHTFVDADGLHMGDEMKSSIAIVCVGRGW